ncbi:MAG: S8 family peptidase [Candidatus Magasanikbacteria bacterium]
MKRILFFFLCFALVTPTGVFALDSDDPEGKQWSYERTGVYEAWDITTGSSDVVVAILDNGFDTFHPELRENAWKNEDEIEDNGIDDDNNGYIDDVWGWNFVAKDENGNGRIDDEENHGNNNPRPEVQYVSEQLLEEGIIHHGTLVAGIIGAKGNNNVSGAGINWNVKLMNVRIIGDNGIGEVDVAAKGVRYAIDNGADVINMSLVGDVLSPDLADAVNEAFEKGIVVVAAAGNDGINMNMLPQYPVCIDANDEEMKIMGVSAMDENNFFAQFSNGGSNCIDITAPGVNISSTLRFYPQYGLEEKYGGGWSGTSFAAPFISGAAALIKSIQPLWTPQKIYTAILETVHRTPPQDPVGYANLYGAGRIQIDKAVQYALERLQRNAMSGVLFLDKEISYFRKFDTEENEIVELSSIVKNNIKKGVSYISNGEVHVVVPVNIGQHTLIMDYNAETKIMTTQSVPVQNFDQFFFGDFSLDNEKEYVFIRKQGKNTLIQIYSLDGQKVDEQEFAYANGEWKVYRPLSGKERFVHVEISKKQTILHIIDEDLDTNGEDIVIEGFNKVGDVLPVNLDDDTDMEVALVGEQNGYAIFFLDHDGKEIRHFNGYTNVDMKKVKLLSGDTNGDGKDDVITYVKDQNEPLRVWQRNGRTLFEDYSQNINVLLPTFSN